MRILENRFEKGWKKLQEVDGEAGERVIDSLETLAPDLAKYIIEFAFGDIYCRPTLDLKQRQLIAISSLATMGGCEPQLTVHIEAGINVGLTPNEIIEAIIHVTPYAGFPRSLNGIYVAKTVFEKKGINPVWEKEDDSSDRYEKGLVLLQTLDTPAAEKVIKSLAEIAPDLGKYVIEFGYGDIYNRPGLELKPQQLITIAAITTLGGAGGQLEFHVGAALNVGLTPNEIIEGIMQTTWVIGFPRVLNAVYAAQNVFNQRGVKPVWE